MKPMIALFVPGVLAALAFAPAAGAATKSEDLYDRYEKLNTPENLAIQHIGGKPPRFVEDQMALLGQIAKQPEAEAVPVVVRIADDYLKRLGALDEVKFRTSSLQALQSPIVVLVEKFSGSNQVFEQLDAFVKCPLLRDYARARALGAVATRRLGEVPAAADPDGTRRGRILIDLVIADVTLSELLHSPTRLKEITAHASGVSGDPVSLHRALRAAASTEARRYAADYAFLVAAAAKQVRAQTPLADAEKALLVDVAARWVKQYKPAVEKEKYPSDLLGQALLALAGSKGNDDLAAYLTENGVKVTPVPEPPVVTPPPKKPPPVK